MLTLAAADQRPLPPWSPGAHIDIELPSGLRRQYSLCGDVGDSTSYQIAVLLQPHGRGGSVEIHDQVRVGMLLGTKAPRNNFPLIDAEHYLLLAGGIGITPLLPMVRELQSMGKQWQLIYGARTRAGLVFGEGLMRLAPDRVHLSDQESDGLIDIPGALSQLVPGTAVYACGPNGLIDAAKASTSMHADSSFHCERFVPAAGPNGEGSTDVPIPFEVEINSTGEVLTIDADESILDVVERFVPQIDYSCREGICGTCEVGLLGGTPEHLDSVLTDDERASGDSIMICVSRSKGDRLVLDL